MEEASARDKIKIIDKLEVLVRKLLENQTDFCSLKEIRVGEEKVMELKRAEKEVREKVRVANDDVEKGEGGIEVSQGEGNPAVGYNQGFRRRRSPHCYPYTKTLARPWTLLETPASGDGQRDRTTDWLKNAHTDSEQIADISKKLRFNSACCVLRIKGASKVRFEQSPLLDHAAVHIWMRYPPRFAHSFKLFFRFHRNAIIRSKSTILK